MNVKITHLAKIRRNRLSHTRTSQNGSALAIAVFIIVVMAVLAAGITKSISSSSDQVVYEVLGTRALFAAESANEKGLAQIFPLTGSANVSVCVASQTTDFSQIGLVNCVATTTCTLNEPTNSNTKYYQIVSTGVCKARLLNDASDYSCGNEKICVSRTIEVEAKVL